MSKSKATLIVACLLALMMVFDRLGDFVQTHVPPYKVGECFSIDSMPMVGVKVLENHILAGYSDVEVTMLILSEQTKVSFQELRETPTRKVDCK